MASNYDTDVTLGVGLDTSQVKATTGNLIKDLTEMFKKAGSTDGLSNNFKNLQARITELQAKSADLISQLNEMDNQKIPTDEYTKLQERLEKIKDSIEQVRKQQELLKTQGVSEDSPAYKQGIEDLKELSDRYKMVEQSQKALEASGKAYTNFDSEKYEQLTKDLDKVNNELVRYRQRLLSANEVELNSEKLVSPAESVVNAFRRMGGAIVQSVRQGSHVNFSSIVSSLRDATRRVHEFHLGLLRLTSRTIVSGIKRIRDAISGVGKSTKSSNSGLAVGFKMFLKYGLGVRSVYMLVRKLRSALVEGFENLAHSNEEFNVAMSRIITSMNWLKNSFAAAFAPLIQSIAPVIESLTEKLVGFVRVMGQFFGALTGKDVMQAEAVYKDYAKSLDESSKSSDKLNKKTKELKKTIAGFDDVEILHEDKDEEEEEKDYSFVPTSISPAISDLANKIKEYLKGIWDVVKQAWSQEGAKLIASIKRALQAIKDLLGSIAKTFYDVFTQGYGFRWLVSVFQLLQKVFDIITAIATEFKRAWDDGNRGYNYLASLFTMFTSINNLLRDIGQSFIDAWNSGAGYDVVASLLELFTEIHNMISAIAEAFRNAWNDGGLGYNLILDILNLWTLINQTLTDITAAFTRAFQSPVAQEMIATILQLFRTILHIIYSITSAFKKAWNDDNRGYNYALSIFRTLRNIFALLKSIGDAFVNAWNGEEGISICKHILNIITHISDAVGTLAYSVQAGWEEAKHGESIWSTLLEIIDDVLGTIDDIAKSTFDWAAGLDFGPIFEAFETLLEKMEPVVDTITNGLEWGYNNVLLPLGEWTIEKGLPALLNDFGAALDVVEAALDALWSTFKPFWDNTLKPLAESIGDSLLEIMGDIQEKLNLLADWISNNKEAFSEIAVTVAIFLGAWLAAQAVSGIIYGIVGAAEALTAALNPLATAIFAVLVLGALLIKNWDEINNALGGAQMRQSAYTGVYSVPGYGTTVPVPKDLFGGGYASGGFPNKGQIFFARENGTPELIGKIGSQTTVANNEQIINGIKIGVEDALTSALTKLRGFGNATLDFSDSAIVQFNKLTDKLSEISQYSLPPIAQGRVLPATEAVTSNMSSNLDEILETLQDNSANGVSMDELRTLLIDVARNYISSSFYLGDEQLARHTNRGNLLLNRIYGQT